MGVRRAQARLIQALTLSLSALYVGRLGGDAASAAFAGGDARAPNPPLRIPPLRGNNGAKIANAAP